MAGNITFGQRGAAAQAPAAASGFGHVDVEPHEDAPKTGGLFGFLKSDEDEFDVRLGSEYGRGKTLWLMIPLWIITGGTGGHRFYLGHYKMGAAFALFSTFLGIMWISGAASEAALIAHGGDVMGALSFAKASVVWYLGGILWVLIDGIYVICRMASSR